MDARRPLRVSRVAFDSNILVYLAGVARSKQDQAKISHVRSLMKRFVDDVELVAPVQTLGELFVVLLRTGGAAADARAEIVKVLSEFATPASEQKTALAAADLVVDHKLQFWDAMIVSAAVDAGCALLLSEDMQHGFVTRGLTIVNPLADEAHPRLMALLELEA